MKLKWIVTDMDGTLLNKTQEISARTHQALMQCQEKGLRVILASGRSYSRLQRYGEMLQMQKYGGYFIEVNGMAIKNVESNERRIYKRLDQNQSKKLFRYLQTLHVEIECYMDDTILDYIPEELKKIKEEFRKRNNIPEEVPWVGGPDWPIIDVRNGYPHIHYIVDDASLPPFLNKMTATHEAEVIERIYPILKEKFADEFEVSWTAKRMIEFTPKGITKGNALELFMNEHRIHPEEVIVFGDGENDISMFQRTNLSVAMGNAPDFVKQYAFVSTLTNDEDGVAVALEKYILHQQ